MLTSLHLTNFRSYSDQTFTFERVTAIIGKNGVGKTNILEAIGFLALARSFRALQDKEAIAWESDVARLVGDIGETRIEVTLSQQLRGGKSVKINGVARRAIELLGNVRVVLFLPESIDLVAGSPQSRRHFLDLVLVQSDRRYAYHLIQLQKILRQRNRLLRQIDEGQASRDQLDFWNDSFVEEAGYLIASRVGFLQLINQTITRHYEVMSGKKELLQLEYKAASISERSGLKGIYRHPSDCPTQATQWQELLRGSIEQFQDREISAGSSLYGPQRDDFTLVLNGRPLSTFGSRGEFRSATLALKAAEADFLLAAKEPVPLIFLLDDAYSELDLDRRGQLATLIGNHQAVITTTEVSYLDTKLRQEAKIEKLR